MSRAILASANPTISFEGVAAVASLIGEEIIRRAGVRQLQVPLIAIVSVHDAPLVFAPIVVRSSCGVAVAICSVPSNDKHLLRSTVVGLASPAICWCVGRIRWLSRRLGLLWIRWRGFTRAAGRVPGYWRGEQEHRRKLHDMSVAEKPT